ncbi:TPA: hypothetical protein ACH3X1_003729 [Trebouxia sp. C0004]
MRADVKLACKTFMSEHLWASKTYFQAYPIRRPEPTTSLGITILHLEETFVHLTPSLQLIAGSQLFFKLQLLAATVHSYVTVQTIRGSMSGQQKRRKSCVELRTRRPSSAQHSAMQVSSCKIIAQVLCKADQRYCPRETS